MGQRGIPVGRARCAVGSDRAEHGHTRSLLRVCDFESKTAGPFAVPPATPKESDLS